VGLSLWCEVEVAQEEERGAELHCRHAPTLEQQLDESISLREGWAQ